MIKKFLTDWVLDFPKFRGYRVTIEFVEKEIDSAGERNA